MMGMHPYGQPATLDCVELRYVRLNGPFPHRNLFCRSYTGVKNYPKLKP